MGCSSACFQPEGDKMPQSASRTSSLFGCGPTPASDTLRVVGAKVAAHLQHRRGIEAVAPPPIHTNASVTRLSMRLPQGHSVQQVI